MAARWRHVAYRWVLDCTHAVVCGCRHTVGLMAYCPLCDRPRRVLARERVTVPMERVAPSPRAKSKLDQWIRDNGGEGVIKRRILLGARLD